MRKPETYLLTILPGLRCFNNIHQCAFESVFEKKYCSRNCSLSANARILLLILNFCIKNDQLRITYAHTHLIFTIHFRRAEMAKESARLKEEAEMMRLNNTR